MTTNDQLATLVPQLKERRALTFQDRIKSLDLRDDIWRKYIELNKNSSIDATAAQRTGLCPDMCCERERLTREFQRLFNPYEFDSDTRALNHSLMVTQYSRASADQAMPSAYDLRPGPVLLHTMNYLITNIMDKFDQDREQSDWYNFLWDRLRAIRKELTQQHLRDEVAIEVLEQCARFHIFCSAFLSEYSRDAFDPNLNDKMLIDCLNQLRECYLTHKQHNNLQSLRNIAEFSSYMLLINLKDDNETLLRIRRLIQDITHVSEIQVALNIHRSLLLSNTTKFFSLIDNNATLLQSCLLHRYFAIIRLKRIQSVNSSTRANSEVPLSDLTDILGMDNDDETRDYLEQLGYSISSASPPCLITSTDNQVQQQPVTKLSQKLIKSKYRGNLKNIITGHSDTPVVIPDTNVEDSFDLQGYFVGKLPFDLDRLIQTVARRVPVVEQPRPPPPSEQQQPRSQVSTIPRRPQSENALRSMAATTTANTFSIRSRITPSTNIFGTATTTTTAATLPPNQSPFRFGGFSGNETVPSREGAPNPFTQSTFPSRLFNPPTEAPSVPTSIVPARYQPSPATIQHLPPPVPPVIVPARDPKSILQTSEQLKQSLAPPPPVARRLSTNSMDVFIDELYQQMIDPFIQETTYTIFDELISQWNKLTTQTVTILDELLLGEISSVATEYYTDLKFHHKMLSDTIDEQHERKRKKYLTKKYFSIWLDNAVQAREERLILQDLQLKYHFLSNEQLLEFLTGIELIADHDLTVEETTNILKSRRYLKKNHLQAVQLFSNQFFDELLLEELQSLVIESNQEQDLREKLLASCLKKQSVQRRERYLQLKYFSLWLRAFRQRRKHAKRQSSLNTNKKRMHQFLQLRSNKKLKENIDQYQTLKSSFDQLSNDLTEIQLFIDKLNS